MSIVFTMKGVAELMEVFEDKVEITPKGVMGFLVKGLKGTKTIPFSSITAIQFKKSGLTSGYLQFTIPGGNESKSGVFSAASDENTFMFTGKNDEAQEIKDYIESKMRALQTPQATSSSLNLSDELQQLAKLKEQGILSDEEFQAAKKRLIG
ncbi:MAG: SHOCT domain-containing protein [Candidatus Marinimicrobia bacterium]|nr:SHOCT domain-containing protein [Candidatus Neomarinimicrobiota bacterium]